MTSQENQLRLRCRTLLAVWFVTIALLVLIAGIALHLQHRQKQVALETSRALAQCTIYMNDLMRMCPGRRSPHAPRTL